MNYAELKERQRLERGSHGPDLKLRAHRTLSWLDRAEQEADDLDARFVFLWIAFNAAYAQEIPDTLQVSEQDTFRSFLEKLLDLDKKNQLAGLVWTEFPNSIRMLLGNRYVFQDFWRSHNGSLPAETWVQRFEGANARAKKALAQGDTVTILAIVLSRIYTLRNQIVHGGSTWNSSVNRDQVRDCANFMGKLVPVVIELMLDNPSTLWGTAVYPVIES